MSAIRHVQQNQAIGIPQGSPLSPVLSNFYLDKFDKAMESEGFKLIRYADDFVILSKGKEDMEKMLASVENSLSKLGLALRKEKTVEINSKKQKINFLGFIVSSKMILPEEKEKADEEWLPVFREEIKSGNPVYITFNCRGAYARGVELIVNLEDEHKEHISWR